MKYKCDVFKYQNPRNCEPLEFLHLNVNPETSAFQDVCLELISNSVSVTIKQFH